MASEILEILIRVNIAAAVAVAIVLALRGHLRRAAGSRIAYALWLAVPVAALGSLLPPRKIVASIPEATNTATALGERAGAIAGVGSLPSAASAVPPFEWTTLVVALWVAGAVAGLVWLVMRQRRFLALVSGRRAKGGRLQSLAAGVGPAVVGAIAPKILLPADFADRFSARERDVVLAHEEFHLRQGHAQTNAAVLVSQCVNWFNPALHMAARTIRLDQELACDEAVIARFPNAKRTYAEAMLKTQLSPDLVLGCYWPAKGSALRQRLSLLKAPKPTRSAALGGVASTLALTLAAGIGAWAAQPPQMVMVASNVPAAVKVAAAPVPTPVQVQPQQPPSSATAIATTVSGQAKLPALPQTTVFTPQEAAQIADIAEVGRTLAEQAMASGDVSRQLKASRESLVEEVEHTRQRFERRQASGRYNDDNLREGEAEYRAAEAALRMFDVQLEKFGSLDRLVEISAAGNRAYLATASWRAYANTDWQSSSGSSASDRKDWGYVRDAAQPKRDPAVIEPGSRLHLHSRLVLPTGKWIGGNGIFTRNGSTAAQDGGYTGDPHYSMASSVRQVGDQVEVSPRVMLDGKLIGSGRALIPSGETASITLDNGMIVTSKVAIRRPTPPKRCCST